MQLEVFNIAVDLGIDRTQLIEELPHEQLIHQRSSGPKTWKVYSRRKGRKGIGG